MHPILFDLPLGLTIYAYGAMLCLSVIAGRELAVRLAEREGLDADLMNRATVWALGGAVIGSRLLYVATNPGDFDGLVEVVQVWNGGVVAYGGFLGGFAGTLWFCRLHRVRVLPWVDCVAPALCLGLMLTRIGCLLGGCDFGQPWNGPWAVTFPAGSPAFEQQVTQGLLAPTAMRSLAVHPTQVYESLAGCALLLVVMAVRRRRRFHGEAFTALVLGYAVLRTAIEMLRADLDRGAVGSLSTSQWIALATFLSAAVFVVVARRRSTRFPRADAYAVS